MPNSSLEITGLHPVIYPHRSMSFPSVESIITLLESSDSPLPSYIKEKVTYGIKPVFSTEMKTAVGVYYDLFQTTLLKNGGMFCSVTVEYDYPLSILKTMRANTKYEIRHYQAVNQLGSIEYDQKKGQLISHFSLISNESIEFNFICFLFLQCILQKKMAKELKQWEDTVWYEVLLHPSRYPMSKPLYLKNTIPQYLVAYALLFLAYNYVGFIRNFLCLSYRLSMHDNQLKISRQCEPIELFILAPLFVVELFVVSFAIALPLCCHKQMKSELKLTDSEKRDFEQRKKPSLLELELIENSPGCDNIRMFSTGHGELSGKSSQTQDTANHLPPDHYSA